ncbi:hypothetical protein N9H39_07010 [Gammaproteobacteria bacterium]|nr:hypothetical protein [Gammaproteobacteria bacterium]
MNRTFLHLVVFVLIATLVPGLTHSEVAKTDADAYSGYYSREQNDGDMARASRNSHYIRFFPDNRIVRLIIPFPYSTTLSADTIRRVFDIAANRTTGSAYIQDTFGLLDEKIVVQLDSVRLIEGTYFFDCGVTVPCRIEFTGNGMNIVQKGIVKDHITAYDLVPDQLAGD